MFYINNYLRFEEAPEGMVELCVSQVAFDSDDDGKLIGQDPAVPFNPNDFFWTAQWIGLRENLNRKPWFSS